MRFQSAFVAASFAVGHRIFRRLEINVAIGLAELILAGNVAIQPEKWRVKWRDGASGGGGGEQDALRIV